MQETRSDSEEKKSSAPELFPELASQAARAPVKTKRIPTTEPAKRLSVLFHRRPTTEWDEKEVKRYKKLVKAGCFESLDDLALIERYYAFERKRGDNGKHRRDLYTLLNNWHGELDRAREYERAHPVVKVRKIIPLPLAQTNIPPEVVDEETRGRFLSDFEKMRGRKLKQPPTAL